MAGSQCPGKIFLEAGAELKSFLCFSACDYSDVNVQHDNLNGSRKIRFYGFREVEFFLAYRLYVTIRYT